jgi:hypothetical protein
MKMSFTVRRAKGVGFDPRLLFITGPCFWGVKPSKQAKVLPEAAKK